MSRSIDRPEEKPEPSGLSDSLSRSGGDQRPRVAKEPEAPAGFGANRRETISFRGRDYRVRPSEDAVISDLGKFRVVRETDLVKGVYSGDLQLARADFRSLNRQGLVRSITFQSLGTRGDGPTRVHTLTAEGYKLALSRSQGPQFFYWGTVKPSEVEHDSLLYRAYLHERDRIKGEGGSIKRVILDSELKRAHYSRVNKPGVAYRQVQEESARELHLPVVDGHAMFPDFRLEYEDERGDLARVDVEVATDNYREQHLAAKMAAGFQVYGRSGGGLTVQSGPRLKGNAFPQETRMVLPL